MVLVAPIILEIALIVLIGSGINTETSVFIGLWLIALGEFVFGEGFWVVSFGISHFGG